MLNALFLDISQCYVCCVFFSWLPFLQFKLADLAISGLQLIVVIGNSINLNGCRPNVQWYFWNISLHRPCASCTNCLCHAFVFISLFLSICSPPLLQKLCQIYICECLCYLLINWWFCLDVRSSRLLLDFSANSVFALCWQRVRWFFQTT